MLYKNLSYTGTVFTGYNFKTLSCTPTCLNPLISQFLHIYKLMKFDVVRLKSVKMEKLEA